MLAITSFYSSILLPPHSQELYKATIVFNESHPIFQGHFPSNPVVPGVTMVQLVKEILEMHLEKKIYLDKISLVKFLKTIDPRQALEYELAITLQIDGQHIKCDAQISKSANVYFKMKSAYVFV